MAKVLAITNQKGGVGKTTTTVNLAAALAKSGESVLVVDLDPQGNATMGSGVNKNALKNSVYDVLMQLAPVKDCVYKANAVGFDLIPANGDLTAAEVQLLQELAREQKLALALDELDNEYHYVLIDCPPSLNMLTLNALVAADGVLIPMQCEYYALEGLSALLNTVTKVASSVNKKLKVEGILRTMFDPRNSLSNEVTKQLHTHFGNKVYRTVIPRNVRLAEAPSHGLSVIQYDKSSKGASAYMGLAHEILSKDKQLNLLSGE